MLRRSKTDKAAAAAAEALAHDPGNGVVVVNDDDDARELLCRAVARRGSVPVPAYDIDSTVTALSGGGIAAVILDLSTGTAASFSVLDAVRQTMGELGQPMPAVMMIATTAANRTLAFDAGVDEFLTRPFHIDDLTTALAAMTARTPEERAALRTQASLAGRGLTDLQG